VNVVLSLICLCLLKILGFALDRLFGCGMLWGLEAKSPAWLRRLELSVPPLRLNSFLLPSFAASLNR